MAREQCTEDHLEQLMGCSLSSIQDKAKRTATTLRHAMFETQDVSAIASALCSNLIARLERSLEFSVIHCKTILSTIDFPAIPRFNHSSSVDYTLFQETEDTCLLHIMDSDMVRDRLNAFELDTMDVEDKKSSDSE